ncbi:MAG: SDR family oxidoreductase [Desulfobacterales bacterium]|jgi:NAD(P)-dependent dehydrogenase (short-subunit alcohol dehydrogenase family)
MSFPKPFNLEGKVALITGGANGLGLAFAEAMAEAGADVACADIDTEGLNEAVRKIEKTGRKAISIVCDVTKEADVEKMVKKTEETLGRLDILFNNAGIAEKDPKPLHEYTTEEWSRILDVDLQGVFYCARAALKIMVRQKSGKIINIASIWGLVGSSGLFPVPAYNSAKGAVVNLTRELGLEYAALGINVNAICPGFYRTALGGGSDDPEFVKAVEGYVPMGKMAEPEDLKGTAIFLASEASDYMCGQMIVTDGGICAK